MSGFLLPDRYEALENKKKFCDFSKLIVPVEEGLDKIDELYSEMTSSGRGAFLILRGVSGCGKTTFLNTLDLFIDDVEIISIRNNENAVDKLNALCESKNKLRVVIIEGRESLLDFHVSEIDRIIHTINRFIRSCAGQNSLIVWPCNNEDILDILVENSRGIGGTSLLGIEESYFEFYGPTKRQYLNIAERTIDLLNDGRTLIEFGITDEFASSLVENAQTIGEYLKLLNIEIRVNVKNVEKLVRKDIFKLWILVLAGNEPSKDVAALTKGAFSTADISRLLVATNANIVEEIKRHPRDIGFLANYLDCRIIYIPIITALSVVRDFADDNLKEILKNHGLSTRADGKGVEKLLNCELAFSINAVPNGMGRKGKTGSDTLKAFQKLADIASTNDAVLNETFGKALIAAGLINEFSKEVDFGTGLTRRTDLLCKTKLLYNIRMEFMWRKDTTRAGIANYTLTKLFNYAKALEIIQ